MYKVVSRGCIFGVALNALTVVLTVLKLCGQCSWSWWVIVSPTLAYIIIMIATVVAYVVYVLRKFKLM